MQRKTYWKFFVKYLRQIIAQISQKTQPKTHKKFYV